MMCREEKALLDGVQIGRYNFPSMERLSVLLKHLDAPENLSTFF